MSECFWKEDTQQVSPSSFEAFGIHIESRYGRSNEIREMLDFAEKASEIGINNNISHLFFDSKAQTCFIETAEEKISDELNSKIQWAARRTLSQFQWNDYCDYKDSDLAEIYNKYA
ncbi:MAG: hypothetical protein Pg6C_05740 [Treponemataceae bacterium]|nr:MAG: hypothetical protein Pg6C_05740 [Treponemataceae bacterium]